jgi:hypothetical protein
MKKKLDENGEGWVNAREWLMAEFARMKLTPEEIKARMQRAKDIISHQNIKTRK